MSKIKGLIVILARFFINGCIVKADNEEYYLSKRRFANVYAVYDGTDRVHLFYGQSYIINN